MKKIACILLFVIVAVDLGAEDFMISYKPFNDNPLTVKIKNYSQLNSCVVYYGNVKYGLALQHKSVQENIYIVQKTSDFDSLKKALQLAVNNKTNYRAEFELSDGKKHEAKVILPDSAGLSGWRVPGIFLDAASKKINGVAKYGVSIKVKNDIGGLYESEFFGFNLLPEYEHFDQNNYKFSAVSGCFLKYQSGMDLVYVGLNIGGYFSNGDLYQNKSSWQGMLNLDLSLNLCECIQLRGHGQFNKIEGDGRGTWFVSDLSTFAYVFGKKNGFGVGYQMNNDNTVVDDRIKQYLVFKYIHTLGDNTQQSFEVKLLDKDSPVIGGSLSYKL